MADLAQYRAWLTEAENVRHQLAMGEAVAEIWRDGRRMTYNKTNAGDLENYIGFLTSQIAKLEDAENGTSFTRRTSIGVIFNG